MQMQASALLRLLLDVLAGIVKAAHNDLALGDGAELARLLLEVVVEELDAGGALDGLNWGVCEY
jgi:hypothetical protein